jgi:uncharacterized protein (DUF983 family)
MDEKIRRLIEMGKKVICPRCHQGWRPELLKDKRCPNCQRELVKEIEMALGR